MAAGVPSLEPDGERRRAPWPRRPRRSPRAGLRRRDLRARATTAATALSPRGYCAKAASRARRPTGSSGRSQGRRGRHGARWGACRQPLAPASIDGADLSSTRCSVPGWRDPSPASPPTWSPPSTPPARRCSPSMCRAARRRARACPSVDRRDGAAAVPSSGRVRPAPNSASMMRSAPASSPGDSGSTLAPALRPWRRHRP